MAEKPNMTSVDLEPTLASRAAYLLIGAVIVFSTLFYGTVHQPILSLFYIAVAIIVIFWIIDSFLNGYFRFDPALVQVPLALAVLYGIIQMIPFGVLPATGGVENIPRTISFNPYGTQVAVFHFAALLLWLASLLAFTDGRKRLKTLVRLIILFGSVYAFYAILQLVLSPTRIYGIYTPASAYAIPFGSFVNRNNFAAYIEMPIALSAGLLLAGAIEKDKWLLYLTGLGIMGVSLLLSGSRAGLIAMVAGLCLLAILTRRTGGRGRRSKLIKIAAGGILVAAIIAGAFVIGGESSLTRISDTSSSREFTINRTEIWSASLRMISENMPFGVGMGAFGVAYSEYDRFNGLERVEQAHNDYLEVLATTGIFGAAIGLLFIFFLFRMGYRALKSKDPFLHGTASGALAGCFAILVHSLFDFVLHTTAIAVLFLSLVAILGVCSRLARMETAVKGKKAGRSNVTPISFEESA